LAAPPPVSCLPSATIRNESASASTIETIIVLPRHNWTIASENTNYKQPTTVVSLLLAKRAEKLHVVGRRNYMMDSVELTPSPRDCNLLVNFLRYMFPSAFLHQRLNMINCDDSSGSSPRQLARKS